MRKKMLPLILLLGLLIPVLAQGSVTGHLIYSDGEKVELTTGSPDEFDQAFQALLDGTRDGKLEMFLDGKPDGTAIRTGEQIEITGSTGEKVTMTVEQARAQWGEARVAGQLNACKSNLKNLAIALEMWATDHDGKYPDKIEALSPDYLIRIPTCPASTGAPYTFKEMDQPTGYELECTGDHSAAGYAPGYPAIDGLHGLLDNEQDRKRPVDTPEEN